MYHHTSNSNAHTFDKVTKLRVLPDAMDEVYEFHFSNVISQGTDHLMLRYITAPNPNILISF